MVNTRLLALVAVALMVGLAGCTTGMDTTNAIDGSEAVDSVELTTTEDRFGGETLLLNMTLNESVEKNDQRCFTQYNPALKITETKCYNNWHNAAVTSTTVTHNGSEIGTYDVSNGETLSTELQSENGEYRFYFHSNNAADTWFQVTVNGDTIESAGYDDTY